MHFSGLHPHLARNPVRSQQHQPRNPVHSQRRFALDLQFYLHTTLFPHSRPSPLPARVAAVALVQLGADSGFECGSVRHPRNVLAADNVEWLVTLSQQVH